MSAKVYLVRAVWDAEAKVWIATSDDVPGLCAESASWPELIDVVRELAPELLTLNQVVPADQKSITIRVVAEDEQAVTLAA